MMLNKQFMIDKIQEKYSIRAGSSLSEVKDIYDKMINMNENISKHNINENTHSMFADTETTGLPVFINKTDYYPFFCRQYYEVSRMVEISWCLDEGETKTYIIKPDDFFINNSAIHTITQEKAETEGKPINEVFDIFYEDIKKSSTFIAHNVKFDWNIIMSEAYRYGRYDILSCMINIKKICTVELAEKVLGKCRMYKYPSRWKLINLYPKLFNETYEAHRACSDAEACRRCFFCLSKDPVEEKHE